MFRAMLAGDFGSGCSLEMARAQVRAVELLTETLPVRTLSRSATRRADGQWTIPGVEEVFDRIYESGEPIDPEWT